MSDPFSNGSNGDRDSNGRFKPGWRGGPGNPAASEARELNRLLVGVLHKVVTRERLERAYDKVLAKAEAGDVPALKFITERMGGTPPPADVLERIESLEAAMGLEETKR